MPLIPNLFFAALPWALSLLTFVVMWMAGNKDVRAWYIGLVGQVFWVIFDLHVGAYGLLPIGVLLSVVYVRNILQWRRDNVAL